MKYAVSIIIVLLITACEAPGRITATLPGGGTFTVTQPHRATTPATMSITATTTPPATPNASSQVPTPGNATAPPAMTMTADASTAVETVDVSMSTGNAERPTAREMAIGNLSSLTWLGGLLMVAGVGLLVAKIWLPIIPTTAGSTVMVGGLLMVASGYLLSVLPVWIVAVGAGVLIVAPSAYATWRDKSKIKAATAPKAEATS